MKSLRHLSLTTLFFFLLVQLAFAQKQTRNVGQFEGVNLGISAKLYIKQGNASSVVIEASEDALEHIKTGYWLLKRTMTGNGGKIGIPKTLKFM